jgi:cobalt/nickel transport protein
VSRGLTFTLAGLAVALVAGVVLSNFASPDPDGLESAVLRTQCADAADPDACLAEAAGDPVFTGAPLPDYAITPLSGFLGVLLSFGLAAGVVALVRRGRPGEGGRAPSAP